MKRLFVLLSILAFAVPAFSWTSNGVVTRPELADTAAAIRADIPGGAASEISDSLAVLRAHGIFDTVTTTEFTALAEAVFSAGMSVDGTITQTGAQNVTGTVSATAFVGDGSGLTGVGAAAAAALSITAKAGENIDIGEAVYISGATGGFPQVMLADNTDEDKAHYWGLAAETKTTGQSISIRVAGSLGGLNTSAFSEGDAVYLSTAGAVTNVQPTSGAIIHIGHVSVDNPAIGEIVYVDTHEPILSSTVDESALIRLGDAAGGTTVDFKDYNNVTVGWIDSDGLAAFSTGLSITNIRSGTGAISFNNDNLVTTGTLGAGATTVTAFDVRNDQDGATQGFVTNDTAGAAARAQFWARSNSNSIQMSAYSSSFTTSNQYVADSGLIEAQGSSQLGISASTDVPIVFYTNATERGRITSTGLNGMVIGATTPLAATVTTLTASSQVNAQSGNTGATPALKIGADVGATTITDGVRKYGVFSMPHFDSDTEQDFGLLLVDSDGTNSVISIGGGPSTVNSATIVNIVAAADDATVSGSAVATFTSTGMNSTVIGATTPAEATVTTLTANGNTGLGTASAGSRLEVHGTANDSYIQKWFNADGTHVGGFYEGANTAEHGIIYVNDNTGTLKVAINGGTGNSYLNGGGNFGIGTAAPANLLELNGTIAPIGDARCLTYMFDDTAMAAGNGAGIGLGGIYKSGDNFQTSYAAIWSEKSNGTDNNYDGELHLGTRANGGTIDSDLVIDASGNLILGHTAATAASGLTFQNQTHLSAANGGIMIAEWSNGADAYSPRLEFMRSRGTAGVFTAVADNDIIGHIKFAAADGTDATSEVAAITVEIDGTAGANDVPGRMIFSTTADGAATPTERMRLDSSGNLGLGVTPQATWHGDVSAYQIGGNATMWANTSAGAGTAFSIAQNAFYNSSNNPTYISNDEASYYNQVNGTHAFYTAGASTGTITWGPAKLTIANTGATTIAAAEANAGLLTLCADECDDDADEWRFAANVGGTMEIQTYATGSHVSMATFTPGTTNRIAVTGLISSSEDPVADQDLTTRIWVLDQMAAAGAGTVTSVASGAGLTGGPITTTGTLALTGNALALHNLAVTDGNIAVGNGATWVAESGATALTSLGAQPVDAGLTDISGLAVTDGNVIVGDGANWVAESGATARTSLGAQQQDAELDNIAAMTPTLNTFIAGDGNDFVSLSAADSRAAMSAQVAGASLDTLISAGFSGTGEFARVAVTAGAVPYGDGSALAVTSGGATSGYVLTTNGAGTAPTWEASALGLGTMSTQDADAVAITGGTVVGLTHLYIASAGPTLTTELSVTGDVSLETTTPQFNLYEVGAPANELWWQLSADAGQLDWFAVNTAGTATDTFMTVPRTGAVVAKMEFPSSYHFFGGRDGGTLDEAVVSRDAIGIDSNDPRLKLYDADGDADEKLWTVGSAKDRFKITAWEDDAADSTSALVITRSGTEPALAAFNTKVFVNTTDVSVSAFVDNPELTVFGDFLTRSSAPIVQLYETDEVSNEKNWKLQAAGSNLVIAAGDDTGSSWNSFLTFRRTGETPVSISTPIGLPVGMGTSGPQADLHLYNNVNDQKILVQTAQDSLAQLHLANSGGYGIVALTGQDDDLVDGSTGNSLVFEASGSDIIEFANQDTVQIRIKAGGNFYVKKGKIQGSTGAYDIVGYGGLGATTVNTIEGTGANVVERSVYSDNIADEQGLAIDAILAGTGNTVVGSMVWKAQGAAENGANFELSVSSAGVAKTHRFAGGGSVAIGGTTTNAHDFRINNGASYSEIDAGEATFSVSSARALKKNLKLFRGQRRIDVWKAFQRFDIYNYQWRSPENKEDIKVGPMADEFVQVSEVLRPGEAERETFSGHDMMMAQAIIIQDLMKKVEALEAKTQRNEARISYLEGRR